MGEWERWSRKAGCLEDHDPVCDLCHYDAHVQAHLPVTEELKELAMLADDYELPPHRDLFLRNFLEEELRRAGGAAEERKNELCSLIAASEAESADDNRLNQVFEKYIAALPEAEDPQSGPQKYRLYVRWEAGRNQELAGWRDELAALESHPLDNRLVYNNARDRLLSMLEAEARDVGLLPAKRSGEKPLQVPVEEHSPEGVEEQKSNPGVSADSEFHTRSSRIAKGLLTPEKEFIKPILESLVELKGSARSTQVMDKVKQKMEAKFTEYDRQAKPSDPSVPRWLNQARWCRHNLVHKHGFLSGDSPRGIWEITATGRGYLEDLEWG